jgi:hypothetical protein
VIDPGIKLLRQVGFHSAAGFGRNELRKSVVLSFSSVWAFCFVWVFGFLSPHGLKPVLLCFLETGFGGACFQSESIRKMISYLG